MNKLKVFLKKLISLGMLAAGLFLAGMWLWRWRIGAAPEITVETTMLILWPGCLIGLLGIYGLLPAKRNKHKGRAITYPLSHGNVVILLDSVEANLNRVIGKLHEVKWISVHVTPSDDGQKARVDAEVKLMKNAGESAREIANHVGERLADTAANLLGIDEVTIGSLVVYGIGLHGEGASPLTAPHIAHGAGAVPEPAAAQPEPSAVTPVAEAVAPVPAEVIEPAPVTPVAVEAPVETPVEAPVEAPVEVPVAEPEGFEVAELPAWSTPTPAEPVAEPDGEAPVCGCGCCDVNQEDDLVHTKPVDEPLGFDLPANPPLPADKVDEEPKEDFFRV